MAVKRVDRPRSGPLEGATLGERLEDALEQLGLSKSAFGRRIGVSHRQVQRWIKGAQPKPGTIAKITKAIPVTSEELIGVAEGQEPPFESWRAFLETADGKGMTAAERRTLAAIPFEPGKAPTTGAYLVLLSGLRLLVSRSN